MGPVVIIKIDSQKRYNRHDKAYVKRRSHYLFEHPKFMDLGLPTLCEAKGLIGSHDLFLLIIRFVFCPIQVFQEGVETVLLSVIVFDNFLEALWNILKPLSVFLYL